MVDQWGGNGPVRLMAQAGSGLLSIGRKWIQITLVLTRTGRVLTFTQGGDHLGTVAEPADGRMVKLAV